jgi:hypothetical protein
MLDFLSVETPTGIKLRGLRLMMAPKGPWVALPIRPQVDREGTPRLDANGKPLWSPIVEFRNRAIADRFRDAVLRAFRLAHPGALDRGAR